MPRRTDLHTILIIGSGPIVIGQACEFDYSGTQAVKALKGAGYRVVLVNSNPATIMTDPELADRTYLEPLTVPVLECILARERPDALLPTVGGQTALNLATGLDEAGLLERYGVGLIGASPQAIRVAESRRLFKEAMTAIGLETPRSGVATTLAEALTVVQEIGFPAIIRLSFTLGGTGGGIAYNAEEFRPMVERGLARSPIGQGGRVHQTDRVGSHWGSHASLQSDRAREHGVRVANRVPMSVDGEKGKVLPFHTVLVHVASHQQGVEGRQ